MDIEGMAAATMIAVVREEELAADITVLDAQRRAATQKHIDALIDARSKCDGLAAFGVKPDDVPLRVRQWCEQDRHQRRMERMT